MRALPFVSTGVANLAAVRAAFARLDVRLVEASARDARDADRLLVPGVGNFGAARRALEDQGLVQALQARAAARRPTLGVCLGMQLFFEASDEAPGAPGLGALQGRATRFPSDVRCPQMGWNLVTAPDEGLVVGSGYAYFANSFRVRACDAPGFAVADARHGGPFVAAVEHGAFVLCQFHPELSGSYGQDLLRRWLAAAARPEEAPC